jgi:hypothetical protein
MNKEEFLKFIEEGYKKALAVIVKKNADYATGSDPFKNFKMASLIEISPERAILVRVSDKLARISNLLMPDKEATVKDETVDDTILDMINYLAILRALIYAQKKEETPKA